MISLTDLPNITAGAKYYLKENDIEFKIDYQEDLILLIVKRQTPLGNRSTAKHLRKNLKSIIKVIHGVLNVKPKRLELLCKHITDEISCVPDDDIVFDFDSNEFTAYATFPYGDKGLIIECTFNGVHDEYNKTIEEIDVALIYNENGVPMPNITAKINQILNSNAKI